jgi:hypothetical protein
VDLEVELMSGVVQWDGTTVVRLGVSDLSCVIWKNVQVVRYLT